jgi:hypothetical protein
MKNLYFVFVLFFILSCKTKQNTTSENPTAEVPKTENEMLNKEYPDINIKAQIGNTEMESSSVQLLKASVEGNFLTLKIGYSGGCAEHSFEFIGSKMIAKSLPPIRSIRLLHNANGETCRMYIERKLIIDLRELAYQKEDGSVIKLNIAGLTDQQILYTYAD